MSAEKIESLISLVEEAIKDLNFKKVIEGCTSIIELDNKNSEAYANRAIAYAATEDFTKALKDHAESIALNPDSDAYGNRARTYYESGKPESALADLGKAIELSPSDSGNYSDRGTCFLALNRFEEALLDLNKAISLDPENLSAIGNRGNVHDGMGNYDAAIEDFTKILKIAPMDTFALFNRSNGFYKAQKFDLAIADLTTALGVEPDNYDLWFNRGNAYSANNQVEEAISDFSKIIEAEDESMLIQALENRAFLFHSSGKEELAEIDIARAHKLILKALIEQQFQLDDTLLQLVQKQTSLDKARLIDHCFYGKNEALQAVQKRVSTTDLIGKLKVSEKEFVFEFSEMYIPKDVKTRTAELTKIAFEEGAIYDGWGTGAN